MKKLMTLLLALCFVFALCACGSKDGDTAETTKAAAAAPTQPEEPSVPAQDDTTVDDGKVEYAVTVVDTDGNPVSAVEMVQVCDDANLCSIAMLTDGTGTIRLVETNYKAKLMSMPEGYTYAGAETEFTFDENNSCTITLKKDDGKVTYTVKVVDEAGNPVSAVEMVQVCDDANLCSIVMLTDGVGSMDLKESVYHANLMSMPEGYEFAEDAGEEKEVTEIKFDFDEDNSCTIVLKAVQ